MFMPVEEDSLSQKMSCFYGFDNFIVTSVVGNNASPKTNNHKKFIRLKIYYILLYLDNISLSIFPCYKFCPNAMSLNFDSFISTH